MFIFNNVRGRAAKVVPTAPGEIASFSFPGFDYESLYAIVTTNQLKFSANHQVMDTIGGDVYLTSFGEAMSPIGFSGFLFSQICDDPVIATGPERLMQWWRHENLSARRDPITVTYGFNTAIRGFVIELDISSNNAKDRLWSFNMIMLKIPFRAQIEDSRFAEASSDVESTDNTDMEGVIPGVNAGQLTAIPGNQAAEVGPFDFVKAPSQVQAPQLSESVDYASYQPDDRYNTPIQLVFRQSDRLGAPVTFNETRSGSPSPTVLSSPL